MNQTRDFIRELPNQTFFSALDLAKFVGVTTKTVYRRHCQMKERKLLFEQWPLTRNTAVLLLEFHSKRARPGFNPHSKRNSLRHE